MKIADLRQAQNANPLPRYRSHKTVEALKIKAILNADEGLPNTEDSGERILTFEDEGYQACAFAVSREYMQKHKPQVGGYWVRYSDGYQSWSPAEAFEGGYSLEAQAKTP